jgi:hypothetical protein
MYGNVTASSRSVRARAASRSDTDDIAVEYRINAPAEFRRINPFHTIRICCS